VAINPVSHAVDASSPAYQFYKSGVIMGNCTNEPNHGSLVVGYNNTANPPYWILKNWYGTNFGENGYVRVLKTNESGPGVCGVASYTSYPAN